MRIDVFRPVMVVSTPTPLESGVLYISERFKTAIHLCACGCGEKVVTPLNPAAWQLNIVGGRATLSPSVGNWSMECKSHYFIRGNSVVWARAISQQAMKKVFASDQAAQARLFKQQGRTTGEAAPKAAPIPSAAVPTWKRLLDWLLGR